jgi:hypothetical protein
MTRPGGTPSVTGLRDLGYLEGQNIAFDYAYGDGAPERLAEAATAAFGEELAKIGKSGFGGKADNICSL